MWWVESRACKCEEEKYSIDDYIKHWIAFLTIDEFIRPLAFPNGLWVTQNLACTVLPKVNGSNKTAVNTVMIRLDFSNIFLSLIDQIHVTNKTIPWYTTPKYS